MEGEMCCPGGPGPGSALRYTGPNILQYNIWNNKYTFFSKIELKLIFSTPQYKDIFRQEMIVRIESKTICCFEKWIKIVVNEFTLLKNDHLELAG